MLGASRSCLPAFLDLVTRSSVFHQAQDQEHLSVVNLGGAQALISILSFSVTRTFDSADGIPSTFSMARMCPGCQMGT